MSTRGFVLKTDGDMKYVEVESYKDIQNIVGGFIEAISFGDNKYFCYANEEAKLLELPENKLATDLWYNSGQRILLGDFIAGDVIFFGGVDAEGNDLDIEDNFSFLFI